MIRFFLVVLAIYGLSAQRLAIPELVASDASPTGWRCNMGPFEWKTLGGVTTIKNLQEDEVIYSSESGAIIKGWKSAPEPWVEGSVETITRISGISPRSLSFRVNTTWYYQDGTSAHSRLNVSKYQVVEVTSGQNVELQVRFSGYSQGPEGDFLEHPSSQHLCLAISQE